MATPTIEDVFKLLGYIQDDLRQTQAKLVEVRTQLSAMDIPSRKRAGLACGVCGLVRATEDSLRDHLANVHGIEPKEAA
jgi:hypothetical protein